MLKAQNNVYMAVMGCAISAYFCIDGCWLALECAHQHAAWLFCLLLHHCEDNCNRLYTIIPTGCYSNQLQRLKLDF